MTAGPDDVPTPGSVVARLARMPSAAHRDVAGRRLARQLGGLVTLGAILVVALMFTVDAPEIRLMPPRGAPQLWPVRVITDFGKDAYVLWASGLLLLVIAIARLSPAGRTRPQWEGLEIRLAFIFLSVAIANLIGDGLKGAIGRARPFVGGHADVLQFSPWAWHEPFESLPSAHAITAVALGFAVATVWPRSRAWMLLYALVIIASRLVLVAHHPSDVVAGSLVAVAGTLLVRYWFAARGVGFAIDARGAIRSA